MKTLTAFRELALPDAEAIERWAATALFSAAQSTEEIGQTSRETARALVRYLVWTYPETYRMQLVVTSYQGDDAAAAEKRMKACREAVRGAAEWPLLADWQVAR
ncbi:hypothetical protein ACFV1W_30220 [Kitasatospora sp. NPDC059648]|uniref:hypothetical protein n=1 Tax=Kitasatospora sp. NPDC059648 TaxID=3346894 RepID=UPI00368D2CF6